MRAAQVGIRTSLVAVSALAALVSSQAMAYTQPDPSGIKSDWTYTPPDPSNANWAMVPVRTLTPRQSPTLPNASSFLGGVYVDYSWSFPYHGSGNRRWVYGMTPPFGDANHDGALPPNVKDGTSMDVSSADYTVSCNGTVVSNVYTGSLPNLSTAPQYLCTLYNAPEFDASTLVQALDSVGWNYAFAFPISDPGNGKGLLFWSSDPVDGTPVHQGVARIYNINWQNQFPSVDVANCAYDDTGACMPDSTTTTFPYADAIGSYINGLASPFRESTMRGYQMFPGANADIAAFPYAVIVTDSWTSAPVQPPLPPAPTVAAGLPPDPLNIALSGNGGAIGKLGAGVANAAGAVVPFDTVAFCSAPGKNGLPRTQAWISACIAAAPH